MYTHYRNYYWKMGKPYGTDPIDPLQAPATYKIVADPYFKRISIEKYQFARLDQVIYDSLLLDFRHLSQKDQMAWQREILKEEQGETLCLLRNQDDRAVLWESLTFEQEYCRSCTTSSIHGIPIATHRMFYRALNDPFDGVVLYDVEGRAVMMKHYEIDPLTREFTTLILEEWNMQNGLSGQCPK